jgi:DNA-binding MarR family transcriptional regulator
MPVSSDVVVRELLDIVPVIMGAIRGEMRSRRTADLTIPQFRAMLFIDRNPGCSLLAVAEHLGLTAPTVSKMVDKMVHNGVVKRESSTTDRRMIVLTLTTEGQPILETARNGTQTHITEILATLPANKLDVIHQALNLLSPLFSRQV